MKFFSHKSCFLLGFLLVLLLAGCGSKYSIPNADRVKSDLESNEINKVDEAYAELYDALAPSVIPITKVTVNDTDESDNRCDLYCSVTLEDEYYRKEYELCVQYYKVKGKGFSFDSYEILSEKLSALKGVPDEYILSKISGRYSYEYENVPDFFADISELSHNFDASTQTDTVTAICKTRNSVCTQTHEVIAKCSLTMDDDRIPEWTVEQKWIEKDFAWTFTSLPRTFRFNGLTLRINSVDTESQTIDVTYNDTPVVFPYEVKDFSSDVGAWHTLSFTPQRYFSDIVIHSDGKIGNGVYGFKEF